MKAIFNLLLILIVSSNLAKTQTGLVLSVGMTMGFTDNPATNPAREVISGFHGSISGRFGADKWYLRPGLELHKVKLQSQNVFDPFTTEASLYMLKIPAQIGYRLIKSNPFSLRLVGGFQFSYIISIQDNDIGLDHDTMKDTQLGTLIGAGIDLGALTVDLNFEKGFTELYTDTGYKSDYIFISLGFLF